MEWIMTRLARQTRRLINLRREVRWGMQRWRRGFSDCDVWSFDHHLARIIPPALRQLSANLHGVPGHLVTEFGSLEAAEVEWKRILESVAAGFDAWMEIFDEYPQGERLAELNKRWAEGAHLLVKHFGSFWD